MIDLQLPRPILDILVPTWLQAETEGHTFNYRYSILLNELWFIQTIIALIFCLFMGRVLPLQNESRSLFVRQFKVVLITNCCWYILEILITKISTGLWELALHHLVSIPIFILGLMEPNCYSVVYLSPFVWHELYYLSISCLHEQYPKLPWISSFVCKFGDGAIGYWILLAYNVNLLVSGLICFILALKSGGKRISIVTGVTALGLVAVNYWGHCNVNPSETICIPYNTIISWL